MDRLVRARVRRARLRTRREVRATQQARPAHPFAGRRRARRQHRAVVQERAVRVEPGTGKGAWGVFVNTPAMVTHGVGHPGLVASLVRAAGRRRGARPLPVRGGHAGGNPRPLHADSPDARRRCLCGASASGCRARFTRRRRKRSTSPPSFAAQDSLRRADARRARRVGHRNALRFHVGSRRAFPILRARSRRSRRTTCGSACGSIPYVSVHSPLFVELASRNYLLTTADGDPYVFGWDPAPETQSVRQRADAAAGLAASSISRIRARTSGGAMRTRRSSPTAST